MRGVVFNPDGNDLRKVFYYYGVLEEEKIVCPFHDDQRPSCHVNFDDGIFHCFACEASGDAFQFVKMANPKLDGLKALRLYFAILNSEKVKNVKNRNIRKSKKKSERNKAVKQAELYDVAHDYYFGLKSVDWRKNDSTYKAYMNKRGFKDKTLNTIGAKQTITSKNYPLIFPIMDMDLFKGYVCRTIDKHVEKKRKYLYNEGFSRVNTLAGRYDSDVVVLVEGYMDMLKMRQFGLNYVAAILGWKITRNQIDKLKAMGVKYVISALDMDKPGRDGTEYLKNFFTVIKFKFPKDVKDPGDLTKKQFDIAYEKTKRELREIKRRKK